METILITDTQTPLGLGLAKRMLEAGMNVVAAPSDREDGRPRKRPHDDLKKKNAVTISWNRSSPLSCQTLLLQGRQKFSSINAAFILMQPLREPAPFTDLKYLDIETALDQWVKGTILLARDLLTHFIARQAGALGLVGLFLPKSDERTVLDDLCREALLTVFDSLAKTAKAHDLKVNAFLSRSQDPAAYADFVSRTFLEKCNKTAGKLFYFQWK